MRAAGVIFGKKRRRAGERNHLALLFTRLLVLREQGLHELEIANFRLYHEVYRGLTYNIFIRLLVHGVGPSYIFVKRALKEARLMAKGRSRGRYRKQR